LGLALAFEPAKPEIPVEALRELALKYGLDSQACREADELVGLLTEKRAALRKEKNWLAADQIRDDLHRLGVILEDAPGRTLWRYGKS
jgi:cysteinyl-tRNA synthetase